MTSVGTVGCLSNSQASNQQPVQTTCVIDLSRQLRGPSQFVTQNLLLIPCSKFNIPSNTCGLNTLCRDTQVTSKFTFINYRCLSVQLSFLVLIVGKPEPSNRMWVLYGLLFNMRTVLAYSVYNIIYLEINCLIFKSQQNIEHCTKLETQACSKIYICKIFSQFQRCDSCGN